MEAVEITDVIRRLALLAGAEIMKIYESGELGVRAKDDASPVTVADEAADKLISDGLRSAFPHIPCVTEEQANSHSLQADRFFIVDPLDGTKEFIHRRGDFTVNIALIENGVPVLGVVYAPARERLFITRAHGGAVEESGGEVREIHVTTPDSSALRVVASKSHRDAATDDYIGRYSVADMKSAGSSLKFCLVATGEADFYPRVGRTMEWDTAAGHAVLNAAGGSVVRFDDLSPLVYGKSGYENPFFIATAPGIELIPGG